jgi:hypothetical protein
MRSHSDLRDSSGCALKVATEENIKITFSEEGSLPKCL